jgi:long-chain acyl-CoA synthetase
MTSDLSLHTLADIPRAHARTHPERRALAFEGRDTTYGELDERASRVAQALAARGLRAGDRIAYLGKNSDRYYELLFGAARAGVVMTPVNWRLAPAEAQYIIEDCDARMLFVGAEFVDRVAAYAPVRRVADIVGMEQPYNGVAFDEWRDSHPARDPEMRVPPEAPAVQLYTSGTTGHPKGAVLTHANFLAMPASRPELPWSVWTEEDVSLAAMPCFHIGGTGWGILGLRAGALNVVMREFDPTKVLEIIERWRISKLFLVPAAMHVVVRDPRARQIDYSQLKYMLYGASPMPPALLKECMDVFGCGFVQLYGMTETTGTVTALGPEDHERAGNKRMNSAGKPLPGVEVAILDPSGRRLPPNDVGEIAVRSPTNMLGYWKLPDATAKTIEAGNWLRSGDAGYMDEDGYVYIHDRVKDMIISGGENIYPAEVEKAIFGHPDVADVAVIGVPSERWGEEVKAIVAPRPGSAQDAASIIEWARERIAHYKAPKSVDFVASLPRNASGKILRRELREPYWKGRARNVN